MTTIDWDLVINNSDVPLCILSWLYKKVRTTDPGSSLIVSKFIKIFNILTSGEENSFFYKKLLDILSVKDRISELMELLIFNGYIKSGEVILIDGVPDESQRKILRDYFGDYLTFEVTGLKAEAIIESGCPLGEDMFPIHDSTLEKTYMGLITGILHELSDLKATYRAIGEYTCGEFLFEGFDDFTIPFRLDYCNRILVIGEDRKIDISTFPSVIAHEILKYSL